MTSKNIFEAMFDVRPTKSGNVDFGKTALEKVIKLVVEKEADDFKGLEEESGIDANLTSEEIARIVANLGGVFHASGTKSLFRRPDIKKTPMAFRDRFAGPDFQTVDYTLPESKEGVFKETQEENAAEMPDETDHWLDKLEEAPVSPPPSPELIPKLALFKNYKAAVLVVLVALAIFFAGNFFRAKNNGQQAVANLESAKENLEKFDFGGAALNFSMAKESFRSAGKNLNLLGLNLVAVFKGIPGLDKANSAKNLISAGEKLAKAGESLSFSLDRLSKTNFVSYFGFNGEEKKSLSIFVDSFKKPILQAKLYMENANEDLGAIDDSIIPDDKKEVFSELKLKLPLFEKFVGDAVEYSDFLSSIIGESSSKKYLLIFQNTSELRPTGGFPGSHALISLNKGYFESILVDDVYNPDGQIKENIIPPKPLQHITPNWGMRDANWFADFPSSARKIIEFYKRGSGGIDVDGVFSMTPDVIIKILEVVGSIELPGYDVAINAENFLEVVQNEVEYGEREEGEHAKMILADFTPLFLERLSRLPQESWIGVSEILLDAASRKQILAYFVSPVLQNIAVKNGFAGEVKNFDGDYISIIHANVKGSKSDAYTDTKVNIETSIMGSHPKHRVTITRKHNGGNTKYGFYNRTNPDYIRVLVPEGSKLLSIEGADRIDYRPIVSYNESNFATDPDLEKLESTLKKGDGNVEFLKESGKDVFAFWLVVQPGKEKSVILEYISPAEALGDYSLYIQKQSGTIGHKLDYAFEIPSNLNLIYKSPYLSIKNGKIVLDSNSDEDKLMEIRLR